MKTRLDNEFLNNMTKDRGNYKGPLYFNRKDPRLIVPRFYPALGWTLNFANPYAYIAIAALIVIMIVTIIF